MSERLDQSAHVAGAVLALTPAAAFPNPITFALAGFGLGLVREITEEGEVTLASLKAALGSRLDLTFWTIGGFLAGLIGAI